MKSIKDELRELSEDEFNKNCFDCLRIPANFGSISEGIFLCMQCAGAHRSFNQPIKSINLDQWTSIELNHMKEGGNRNLRLFLNYYSIPKGITREVVFVSKIMTFYRKRLKAKAMKITFNEEPPKEEERFKIDNSDLNKENGILYKRNDIKNGEKTFVSRSISENQFIKDTYKQSKFDSIENETDDEDDYNNNDNNNNSYLRMLYNGLYNGIGYTYGFFSNLAYKGYSYFTWKKVGQDEKENDEKKENLLDENDREDQI